jgi:8-oxo-dGTP diphosphatase/2-hydroxy-dATP diphosphatase
VKRKIFTLLLLRKGNQILLAMKKRGLGEGRWNGIGGKVEADETIEAALIRESQEEVDITPTIFEKVADIYSDEFFKGDPSFTLFHVYIGTGWNGEPKETEEMAPKWFDLKDIPYNDMWPDDSYWLPPVLEGKKVIATFKLDESDAIVSHSIKEVAELSN